MEHMRCEIRTMRTDDASMLFYLAEEELHPLAVSAGHAELFHPDEFLRLLERATVFVAELQGEIAGYVAVEDDDDALAVRVLVVNPAYETSSICDQLLDWIEGLGFSRRVSRLAAFVPAADERSLRVYRGHEFVPQPAADRPEMIVMEKRLPTM